MSHRSRLKATSLTALALLTLSACALLCGAPAAQATIQEGHPEAYDNGGLVGNREHAIPQEGFGEIHLTSAWFGSEGIECAMLDFGTVFNEGSPPRAQGEILSWVAAGHVPNSLHPQLSSDCRPTGTGGFITDEAPVALEENEHHEVEASRRRLSTPLSYELLCGAREEEYVGIVRLGVPSSEFPKLSGSTPCPAEPTLEAQESEYEAYKTERSEKKGCYATNPSPAGCFHFVLVEPGAGLEVAFGGTLWAVWKNGAKNGLSPSRWSFEEKGGEPQCESPGCTATLTITGEVTELGYNGIELMQAK
jgi:hypothetical protein